MKTKEKPLSYNYLTEFNTHDDSLDIIFVKKLRGRTIIGICEDELHKPQEIVLDICIGVPKTKALDQFVEFWLFRSLLGWLEQ